MKKTRKEREHEHYESIMRWVEENRHRLLQEVARMYSYYKRPPLRVALNVVAGDCAEYGMSFDESLYLQVFYNRSKPTQFAWLSRGHQYIYTLKACDVRRQKGQR